MFRDDHMTIIELTDDQRQALQAEQGKPLDVVDPATRQRYVILAQEQYERVRSFLEQPAPADVTEVPPGILRSQQAFWRDLPELLKNKRNHGKTACYFGDECIGIANSDRPLIGECVRRNMICSPFSRATFLHGNRKKSSPSARGTLRTFRQRHEHPHPPSLCRRAFR